MAWTTHKCPRCGKPLKEGIDEKGNVVRWCSDEQKCKYEITIQKEKK